MVQRREFAANGWSLTIRRDSVTVTLDDHSNEWQFDGRGAASLRVVRGWFRWRLELSETGGRRLTGLRNALALELRNALVSYLANLDAVEEELARLDRLRALKPGVLGELESIDRWSANVDGLWQRADATRRWLTRDAVEAVIADRPTTPALDRLRSAGGDVVLTTQEVASAKSLGRDLHAERSRRNESFLRSELREQKSFLETIEKTPLTQEQSRAVLTFDNRVQVIAAAGSGKTSVMVARAAYAIARGLVPARRILVLAFNTAAAAELQERIDTRLRLSGIDPTGLRASTFHSFGLSLIGAASGSKPRVAPWLEHSGGDVAMVHRIVDELRDGSTTFRYRWDLYRLLFARSGSTPEGSDPVWHDRETDVIGHRTLRGETVRSQGEKLIADWLFLNGVSYDYERPYSFDVSDADHSQYRPDFYYPDIDAWHEHWAIGRDGRPPASFVGYAKGMEWKRDVHNRHGTTLIETTWAEIIDSSGFTSFESRLRELGIETDWNPDRPLPPDARPVEHFELAKVVRAFMAHVKAGSLSREDLERRLATGGPRTSGYRSRLFLDLYWEIHDAWESRLRAEGCVDFEDMLIRAAEVVENGSAGGEHDLILVDEFQDSSAARARMIRALTEAGGASHLLAVGDDWQSIYRFAGSDIAVMTDFERWFGPSETVRLETTFRSTQAITTAASTFVSRNPRQLHKKVRSADGSGGAPVQVAYVTPSQRNRPERDLASAVESYLHHLVERLRTGMIEPGRDGRISVDVLGRYSFERDLLPQRIPDQLDVTFRTVHRSKGLEADFVLLPRMIRGTLGFPSQIEDDPVLDLVMSNADPFPFGEERRLFYVALTRARREVTMLTVAGQESPFVVELLKDGLARPLRSVGSDEGSAHPCPSCGTGLLVKRQGRYGEFWGCGAYPRCRHTQSSNPA